LALLQPGSLLAFAFDQTPTPRPSPLVPADAQTQKKIRQVCLNLPLAFEKNEGQTDPQVRFIARGQGYSLFLTPAESVLSLSKSQPKSMNSKLLVPARDVVRMRLVGGNRLCRFEGLEKQTGKSNYFIGNNPEKWRAEIEQYSKVRMAEVYPGIDMVYYGKQSQMEYDFVVKPGADPKTIRLKFEGAKSVKVGKTGDLQIKTTGGNLAFQAPAVYQGEGNQKTPVEGHFFQTAKGEVGFRIAAYDATKTLVIDPSLIYSTYLGGSGDDVALGIAVDAGGNAYVTGQATAGFPISGGAYQMALGGGNFDVFVSKLNVTGSTLIYSTYIGGNGTDGGTAIAINGTGNAFVTGQTTGNFPTTGGVVQTVFSASPSAFVVELNPFGSAIVYSTYLGGSGGSIGYGIAVDGGGNAYVTGYGYANFPTTAGAYQTAYGLSGLNGFVTKLSPGATSLVYSTYLGGTSGGGERAIAVDGAGNAYVTGQAAAGFPITAGVLQTVYGGGLYDAVVTKLNSTGSALVYATYLGGSNDDYGWAIDVDSGGNAYVTGQTSSPNFPITPGAYQTAFGGGIEAFVTKLNPTGTALSYSTYLGGGGITSGQGIVFDSSGQIYVTGYTSGNFPTTTGAYQTAFGGGNYDAFVALLNPVGGGASDLITATYLGGGGTDGGDGIALDSNKNVYVAGSAGAGFPTTAGTVQTNFAGINTDGFVTKLSMATPTNTPAPTNTPIPPCTSVFSISKNKYSPKTDLTQLTIQISLCAPGNCTVKFYNTAGEKVRTFIDNPTQPIGSFSKDWDGKNDKGEYVGSGVYYIAFMEPLGIHYGRVMIIQ